MDDEEHMLFHCTALEEERLGHPSFFERDDLSLADFMAQDPTEMAIICIRLLQCLRYLIVLEAELLFSEDEKMRVDIELLKMNSSFVRFIYILLIQN